ncbi:hypothetical protein [Cupriavidus alkaliphilus]|uniref:hypothetical protein n=1 Tax=Cupriavidus alkaliphilus TaxID=942866 RepID=UPI001FD51CAF|nr:hypothetical protein [Cupriavidus alkaliphilus]
MPRLTELHRKRPDVSVRLRAEFQALDRQPVEGEDMTLPCVSPVRYSQLHADVLLDEYLIPVATPEYLAQHPGLSGGTSLAGVVLPRRIDMGRRSPVRGNGAHGLRRFTRNGMRACPARTIAS